MSTANETTNHDEIQKWAEARNGHPARVKGTGGKGAGGLLRIDFGPPGEDLEGIGWEEFFDIFDECGIKFLYSTEKGSQFNKFVFDRDEASAA